MTECAVNQGREVAETIVCSDLPRVLASMERRSHIRGCQRPRQRQPSGCCHKAEPEHQVIICGGFSVPASCHDPNGFSCSARVYPEARYVRYWMVLHT